ncbi:MAG: hypothetical protein HUJ94_08040 [Bacteroidales bacterium]|nr:hypothetical protein [Bacteroidales bacterium]
MGYWLDTYKRGDRPYAWELFEGARLGFACGIAEVEKWIAGIGNAQALNGLGGGLDVGMSACCSEKAGLIAGLAGLGAGLASSDGSCGIDCIICAEGMLTEAKLHRCLASDAFRNLKVLDILHYQQSEIIRDSTEMHLTLEELPASRNENERPYCDLYILELPNRRTKPSYNSRNRGTCDDLTEPLPDGHYGRTCDHDADNVEGRKDKTRLCVLFMAMDDYDAFDSLFANGFAPAPKLLLISPTSPSLPLIRKIAERSHLSLPNQGI